MNTMLTCVASAAFPDRDIIPHIFAVLDRNKYTPETHG